MRKRSYGKIVNLSSIGVVNPSASLVPYHSAKAGVIGLTVNMAMELAAHNITVNAILPGPIKTNWVPLLGGDMKFKTKEERAAFIYEQEEKRVPIRRMGTPEDIAGAALFLASDLSSYLTGDYLLVAGGLPLPVNQ